jgi:hypothetical protein
VTNHDSTNRRKHETTLNGSASFVLSIFRAVVSDALRVVPRWRGGLRSAIEQFVVDQPRLSDAGRDQRHGGPVERGYFGQGGGVDDRRVDFAQPASGPNAAPCGVVTVRSRAPKMLVKVARARDTGGMATDAQPEPSAAPKLKRRWLQFSTRALLVVVTVSGITLGILGWRAERQRRAVAAIEAMGGFVQYSDNNDFLMQCFPRDWVCHVRLVRLPNGRVADVIAHLQELPALEMLSFSARDATEANLAALERARLDCMVDLWDSNLCD